MDTPRRIRTRPLLLLAGLLGLALPARASTPSNGWVVWASNRKDGRHEIYLMKSDGTGVKRLTFNGGKYPGWSPDGSWIAYTATTDDSTHVLRWNGSGDKKVCDGTFEFWMWDKTGLVCRVTDDHYLVNPDTGTKKLLFKKSDFTKIGSKALNPGHITANGRWLVAHSDIYRNGYSGDNGSFKAYHAAVILDFQNKGKIYYFGQGCEPTTPPSGDLVYHVCGGGPCGSNWPDPYRMNINDISTRSSYAAEISHADADWGHEYFPRISNDGKWLSYGATTGCHDHDTCDYEIWIHKLGAGSSDRTRITNNTANDQWPHLFVGTLPAVGCASAADCDDSDPCTTDSCSGGTCSFSAVSGCCTTDSDCGDNDPCTTDTCSSNKCSHSAVSGCCTANSDCADGDPCTADVCSNNTCSSSAISGCCTQDSDCSDSNTCTTDKCSGNKCQYSPVSGCCSTDSDCDDSNPCTTDSCEASSGTCSNTQQSGCCAFDTDCDDGEPCTLDTCDTSSNTCQNSWTCAPDAGPDLGGADAGVNGDQGGPQIVLGDAAGGDAGVTTSGLKQQLVGGCSLAGRPAARAPWLGLALLLLGWLWRRR